MKPFTVFSILTIVTTFFSCNSKKTESRQEFDTSLPNAINKVVYEDWRENLKLTIADTIKSSASYFFSNQQSKDIFLLTIEPGRVKNSKSYLQIITADSEVIFTQTFDTYYFIKWIYEPDTVPTGGQERFIKYTENYRRSITSKQYDTYFKRNVNNFFEESLNFLDKSKFEELEGFGGEMNDKYFLKEYLADTTIQLIDIICFDCDEGASVIGFSKIQNKVVTLFDHD